MKLKEKLFPVMNPAIIRIYGHFDQVLEATVATQIRNAFSQEEKPDGFILLIESIGGRLRTLTTLINKFSQLNLPCMGFVENEALSAAAELLLLCQYRVAPPFAKIQFHHGQTNIDVSKVIDSKILSFIAANHSAFEKTRLERFCRITGQEMEIAELIYRADNVMPSCRAVELGILHEITEEFFAASPDMFDSM